MQAPFGTLLFRLSSSLDTNLASISPSRTSVHTNSIRKKRKHKDKAQNAFRLIVKLMHLSDCKDSRLGAEPVLIYFSVA